MTIINLTTPMSDDKERQRRNAAILDAIERYTEERMNDAVIFSDEQPLYAEQPSVSVTTIEKHIGEKNE